MNVAPSVGRQKSSELSPPMCTLYLFHFCQYQAFSLYLIHMQLSLSSVTMAASALEPTPGSELKARATGGLSAPLSPQLPCPRRDFGMRTTVTTAPPTRARRTARPRASTTSLPRGPTCGLGKATAQRK